MLRTISSNDESTRFSRTPSRARSSDPSREVSLTVQMIFLHGLFRAGVGFADQRLGDRHGVVIDVDVLEGVDAEAVVGRSQRRGRALRRAVPQATVLLQESVGVAQRHMAVLGDPRPRI